jgi:daunorubicin resistance ABC transporter ATP-binding subunit
VPVPLMIEARGLVKSYGSARALAGLDLSVPAGSTMCLLGPNGAGKTTAVRMLATLLRPEAGWARVGGHDVVAGGAAVRRIIGLSGQYASVDECLTGRSNLVMIGELSRLPRREAKRRAAELLARFGLEQAAGRAVRTYSGGMRRRLDLAASLLGRPSVLFLDEPTTGLDPHSRLTMWEIIRELVGGGTTVLLTTQYLEEADQLADRIAVIDGGRVTAEGTPAELKARVGTAHLRLTVTAGASLARASEVLSSHAAGPVRELPGAGRLEMPVVPHAGLVTGVVRALDAAGIGVDDIALRRPSLDDVFHALTRREGSPGPGLPVPRVPPDGGFPDGGPPAAAPTGERAA